MDTSVPIRNHGSLTGYGKATPSAGYLFTNSASPRRFRTLPRAVALVGNSVNLHRQRLYLARRFLVEYVVSVRSSTIQILHQDILHQYNPFLAVLKLARFYQVDKLGLSRR